MISHKHKSIFVHIPKTGGTSIELALRDHSFTGQYNSYMSGRRATRGWDKTYDNQETPIRENAGHWVHKHRPTKFFKPRFSEYKKFAFVRNSWDRMVSSWAYVKRQTGCSYEFKRFVYEYPFKKVFWDWHTMPQYIHLEDGDGNVLVDFVGRFENLEADLNHVGDRIGLPERIKLPHIRKSKHKHYTEYYDDETQQYVRKLFSGDINRFGYKFGE